MSAAASAEILCKFVFFCFEKKSFFENLQFEPSSKENTFLLAQSIAKNVLDILNFEGVITDITVRPQYFEIKRKKK